MAWVFGGVWFELFEWPKVLGISDFKLQISDWEEGATGKARETAGLTCATGNVEAVLFTTEDTEGTEPTERWERGI
jgi:hypothetical protein